MTLDNVTTFVVLAIVAIFALGRRFGKLRQRYQTLVEEQRIAVLQAAQAAAAARGAAAGQALRTAAIQPPPPAAAYPSNPARRTVIPIARSTDVPRPSAAAGPAEPLAAAFSDTAHARRAVILAEVLAKPVALR